VRKHGCQQLKEDSEERKYLHATAIDFNVKRISGNYTV
jgi:hypothetical protein